MAARGQSGLTPRPAITVSRASSVSVTSQRRPNRDMGGLL